MIPEIELRDIQPKGSSDVPSSSHIQTGLPIPKTVRVQFFSPDEWESFTEEWASYLKNEYVAARRFGGSGDLGIDIAGFCSDKGFEAVWDNYQCKRYGHPLRPGDIWVEIGKIIYYSYLGKLKWSTKTGHRVRVFSSIDFPIRLVVTHHYIRAVLVRCNIQRYSPLLRELHR